MILAGISATLHATFFNYNLQVFITSYGVSRPFQLSPILWVKPGAYPLAMPENIRLVWKGLTGTNTLTYY